MGKIRIDLRVLWFTVGIGVKWFRNGSVYSVMPSVKFDFDCRSLCELGPLVELNYQVKV